MQFSIMLPDLSPPVLEALANLQRAVSSGSVEAPPRLASSSGDGGKFQLEQALQKGKNAAQALVENWKVGWKDPEVEELNRGKILNDAVTCRESGKFLLAYLRHDGASVSNLMNAGAEEELAKNIVAVGVALSVWGARTI